MADEESQWNRLSPEEKQRRTDEAKAKTAKLLKNLSEGKYEEEPEDREDDYELDELLGT